MDFCLWFFFFFNDHVTQWTVSWWWMKSVKVVNILHSCGFFFCLTAFYSIYSPSSFPAVSSLGNLVPLPESFWLEWRGSWACSARRCKAKPLWGPRLHCTNVCQNPRNNSGETVAAAFRLRSALPVNFFNLQLSFLWHWKVWNVLQAKDSIMFRPSSCVEGKTSSPKHSLRTRQEKVPRQRSSPPSPSQGKYHVTRFGL